MKQIEIELIKRAKECPGKGIRKLCDAFLEQVSYTSLYFIVKRLVAAGYFREVRGTREYAIYVTPKGKRILEANYAP